MKTIKTTCTTTAIIIGLILSASAVSVSSCRSTRSSSLPQPADSLYTNQEETGPTLVFQFEKGESFNHPLMALWVEDTSGKYLQTLYVAESIAKGVFGHGDKSTGKWLPGPIRRPATLPVWAHSRGIRENDGYYVPTPATALPDAVTGATPPGDFFIISRLSKNTPAVFNVFFEINQSWDWNEYWTNNKFPDDEDYKTSGQPALVYQARVGPVNSGEQIGFTLIGHSHYSGKDGEIYKDLSTITTAKNITEKAGVKMVR
jgi:hypothetical protein